MDTSDAHERAYIAIDLKSFYASVECVERGLDPLMTNLVVADKRRTDKTICLAVSPSLKAQGVSARPRLFEVITAVKGINEARRAAAPKRELIGASVNALELDANPRLALDYIVAPPRMALYLQRSTEIFEVYLQYVSPEDIHVYSIDEVFMDITGYLRSTHKTAREFAEMLIGSVLEKTNITATVGIGTNLYLAKVAMDIVAKKMQPDAHGVRIAELDEMSYRKELWAHRPLTDFWRIGHATARKLNQLGLNTMGAIARCSTGQLGAPLNEDALYDLFGINAELLIDHAWGWEPCTLPDIKAYCPAASSLSSGQVLHEPYDHAKTRLVLQEMAEQLGLDLVEKGLTTAKIVLYIGYDASNISDPAIMSTYSGTVKLDHYGRRVPEHARGTIDLPLRTSSSHLIVSSVLELFEKISDPHLLSRRLNITACEVDSRFETALQHIRKTEQLDLFTDYAKLEQEALLEDAQLEKEHERQKTILAIRQRFGKNAMLKGINLQEGGLQMQRNEQIGGHKA